MSEYLFIGGPKDGRRISIPPEVFKVQLTGEEVGNCITYATYHKMQLMPGKIVFAFNGMTTPDEVMDKLLEGYQYIPRDPVDAFLEVMERNGCMRFVDMAMIQAVRDYMSGHPTPNDPKGITPASR